jgi:hypothetical protein
LSRMPGIECESGVSKRVMRRPGLLDVLRLIER